MNWSFTLEIAWVLLSSVGSVLLSEWLLLLLLLILPYRQWKTNIIMQHDRGMSVAVQSVSMTRIHWTSGHQLEQLHVAFYYHRRYRKNLKTKASFSFASSVVNLNPYSGTCSVFLSFWNTFWRSPGSQLELPGNKQIGQGKTKYLRWYPTGGSWNIILIYLSGIFPVKFLI